MVKIYHRPDPPPPDVDSNKAVRKTDTFLNREASAGLFQRALVKVQGQERAVERANLDGASQQDQIESDAHSALGSKARESVLAMQSEMNVSNPGGEFHPEELNVPDPGAGQISDTAELDVMPEDLTEVDNTDAEDVDGADQGEQNTGSSNGLDSTAVYQMFENLQQQNNLTDSESHAADTNATNDNVNTEPNASIISQAAVANSAGITAASLESRLDTLSSLSDLIDKLETSSQLPTGNEWTLILEDDGPVSELTLSSDSDGRWNIDLLTSFDNDAVGDDLIGNLLNQLATAGIAVANISLVDGVSTDLPSANQTAVKESGTDNIV